MKYDGGYLENWRWLGLVLGPALMLLLGSCDSGSGPESSGLNAKNGDGEHGDHEAPGGKDGSHAEGAGHEGHGDESGHNDGDEHAAEGHGGEEGHQEGVVQLSPEAAAQMTIQVAPVEVGHVPFVLRATARVDYDQQHLAHVGSRIPGRVARVYVELGDDVKAGQRLASLDSIEFGTSKADFLVARAEESVAKKALERAEHLFEKEISSERTVLEARSDYERASVRLRSAEETLRLFGLSTREITKVRFGDADASLLPLLAPITGRIVAKHLVVGELVRPEQNVFTVADLSALWIWIDVYERDMARVHRDDDVAVRTEAYPGRTFQGRVGYISDSIDADTRVARTRIDLPNSDGALKAGMFAEVVITDIHTKEAAARNALTVPASAVQRDGARDIAFVKVGKDRFERKVIKVGARTEALVEILEGLSAGDQVVTQGSFLLKSEAAKEEMGGGHSH